MEYTDDTTCEIYELTDPKFNGLYAVLVGSGHGYGHFELLSSDRLIQSHVSCRMKHAKRIDPSLSKSELYVARMETHAYRQQMATARKSVRKTVKRGKGIVDAATLLTKLVVRNEMKSFRNSL